MSTWLDQSVVKRRQRMSRSIKVTTNGGLIEEEHHLLDADGMMPDDDKVNHPSHYSSFVPDLHIEAIDCMRAAFGDDDVKAFCVCNALKYVYRHKSKGEDTDIQKAIWYLNKYLELNKD